MTDLLALRGFVDELVRAGVRDAVICPGSRSTALALALRVHPDIAARVLLDERAAGFFALGLAKATRRPVGVLVTSGTAAANLLPAVVEASLGRVPLVLLTADRPPELRDRGAAQTIDQVRLFGTYAKWFAELPLLDGAEVTRRHAWSVAARAVATAVAGPAGPVHLNVPFREPLVPDAELGPLPAEDGGAGEPEDGPAADAAGAASTPPGAAAIGPFVDVMSGARSLDVADLARLAERLGRVERGLIVAGPQDDPALPEAVARLAAALDWPIMADPLSLVRCGPHDRSRVVARGDLLLRPGPWRDAHLPDLVLRVGAMPTSKPVLTLLEERRPAQVVLDGDAGWREAAIIPATFVHADPAATLHALAGVLGTAGGRPGRHAPGGRLRTGPLRGARWLDGWLAGDRAADRALRGWLARTTDAGEPFEGAPFAHLGDLLPDGGILWASSSMPIRDMDAWLPTGPRAIRPMANRGANGIDGVLSSALGAAATGVPIALVIGDLALLHDLTALVTGRRLRISATIVCVDNDGGGIFSFLPQASAAVPGAGLPDHFEELFGTSHGIDLGAAIAGLGIELRRVAPAGLRQELAASLATPGLRVLHLRTARERNLALHREAAAAVQVALAEQVTPSGDAPA